MIQGDLLEVEFSTPATNPQAIALPDGSPFPGQNLGQLLVGEHVILIEIGSVYHYCLTRFGPACVPSNHLKWVLCNLSSYARYV